MKRAREGNTGLAVIQGEKLLGWLRGRLQGTQRAPTRLALLERITIAPRQSLVLVEAEGRRFLVATSPEGGPAFYALDERSPQHNGVRQAASRLRGATPAAARLSW